MEFFSELSNFIIAICAILGMTLCYHQYGKISAAFAPMCAVMTIGVSQYIAALMGFLWWGTCCLQVVGIVGLVAVMWRANFKPIIDNRILIYFSFISVLFFYNLHAPMMHNDAFVFWGAVSKYIFLTQHLPDAAAPFFPQHLTYTLGTSLFHYFFQLHAAQFQPSLAYTAQDALWLAPLMAITYRIPSKNSVWIIILAICCVELSDATFLMNLMVDVTLALYFFAGLWIALVEESYLRKQALLIFPILFLPLIKQVGAYFSGILLLYSFLLWYQQYNNSVSKRIVSFESLMWLVSLCGLIFIQISWGLHFKALHFQTFINAVNADTIKAALFSSSPEAIQLRYIFLTKLFFTGVGTLRLPSIIWMLLLPIFLVYFAKQLTWVKQITILISVWFLGLLGYGLMLFFLEAITFKSLLLQHTAPGLNRYLLIYLMPLGILGFALVMQIVSTEKLRAVSMIVGMGLIFGLAFNYKNYHTLSSEHAYALKKIDQEKIFLTQNSSAKICIRRDDGSDGNLSYIYELIPHKVIFLDNSMSIPQNTCDLII